ncbi:MAG: NAD(P)-dependent oxidoreductase, partial [Actinobacteria bacterium]|nr:NAD(P)-dependent oxidoreductase [Actinomycetota bacterium]
ASSYVMLDRGPRMVEVSEGITPQLVNRIDITAGDLGVALEVAREEGLPTPVAAAVGQVLLRAVRALPPDADDAALIAVVTQD